MVAIEVLEERLNELEKSIYGDSKPSIDDPPPETSVIDNIVHVNTLISSALSGRERTNALVKRLPQLNELLDTCYDDNDLNTDAKLEIMMALEDEIKKNLELYTKFEELKPCLDVDKVTHVSELSPKMEHLTVEYLKLYDESNALSNNIYQHFSKYNQIIDTISKTLIDLDRIISVAEEASAPQKRLD